MNSFAVYHWWDYPQDAPPYANLRSPILLSIATLRAVSDIPIVVLDLSYRNLDEWKHFPDKLGFKVHKIQPHLRHCQHIVDGWKYLSRFFDIRNNKDICEQPNIIYVDSDVFWFKNPEPFMCSPDKMCVNRWNTGYFYFDKYKANEFWDIFESYTKSAIYSQEHRNLLKKYVGYDSWLGVWDEMTVTYMAHENPTSMNFLPHEEHAFMSNIKHADPTKLKMFHANGLSVANPLSKNEGERSHCRGLLALVIKEFYDHIRSVLSQNEIDMIFTTKEQKHYIPQQFSLLGNVSKLLDTKGPEGIFDLQKCLQAPYQLMI